MAGAGWGPLAALSLATADDLQYRHVDDRVCGEM
jgi:hypothetical protein